MEEDLADVQRRIEHAGRIVHPLREVVLLEMERSLWWQAARDASAESLLGDVVARRAVWSRLSGRLDEVEPLARRAKRLSRTSASKYEAAYAALWASDARLRQGGDPFGVARSIEGIAGDVEADVALRAWARSFQASALARAGDERSLTVAEEGVRMAERVSPTEAWNRTIDLAHVHVEMDDPERALDLLQSAGMLDDPTMLWARARTMLAAGQRPPEIWVAAVHEHAERSGIALYQARAAEIRRAPIRFGR